VFGGAIAPLMFTVVAGHDINSLPVSLYVTGACVCTLIGLSLGRNSAPHEDLEHIATLHARTEQ
jgi:hypothetical protein